MAERGVLPPVLSKILNHVSEIEITTSKVTMQLYNRYQYMEERRQALKWWTEFVVGLEKKDKKAASA